MDPGRYAIRAFEPADYSAEARLAELSDPGYAPTEAMIRHWDEAQDAEPGRVRRKLVAVDRSTGTVMGFGEFSHTSFNFHPDKYWLEVMVDPSVRRQGIGAELYRHLEDEVLTRNPICLWGGARADQASAVRFYTQRGYRTRRELWRSRLDVATADLTVLPDRTGELSRSGVRFTTLAEEGAEDPEVQRRVYDLSHAASADVPRLGEYTPVSFEQYLAIELRNPLTQPESFFLAAVGDRYVGLSVLDREPAHPGTLHVGFTGTHPEFRGRGIAIELKRRAVTYAREHGIESLITNNDSLNRPIWSINERLGFRRLVTWLMGEKPARPAARPL